MRAYARKERTQKKHRRTKITSQTAVAMSSASHVESVQPRCAPEFSGSCQVESSSCVRVPKEARAVKPGNPSREAGDSPAYAPICTECAAAMKDGMEKRVPRIPRPSNNRKRSK